MDYEYMRESFFQYINGDDLITEGVYGFTAIRTNYHKIKKGIVKINKLIEQGKFGDARKECHETRERISSAREDLREIKHSKSLSGLSVLVNIVDDAFTNKLVQDAATLLGLIVKSKAIEKTPGFDSLPDDQKKRVKARAALQFSRKRRSNAKRNHAIYAGLSYSASVAHNIEKKDRTGAGLDISDFDKYHSDAEKYLNKLDRQLSALERDLKMKV